MNRANSHEVTGYVVAVEEERFRFETDDGRVLILTLGGNANADRERLQELHRAHAHLSLEYQGEPNLASAAARFFRVLEPAGQSA